MTALENQSDVHVFGGVTIVFHIVLLMIYFFAIFFPLLLPINFILFALHLSVLLEVASDVWCSLLAAHDYA